MHALAKIRVYTCTQIYTYTHVMNICSGGAGFARGVNAPGYPQQGYPQSQMGYAPHMYGGMMHAAAAPAQYYYNSMAMVRVFVHELSSSHFCFYCICNN